MSFIKFEDYLKDVVDGKARGVYEELKKQFSEALKTMHQ